MVYNIHTFFSVKAQYICFFLLLMHFEFHQILFIRFSSCVHIILFVFRKNTAWPASKLDVQEPEKKKKIKYK